jgi:type I restriction enzyme S subunit
MKKYDSYKDSGIEWLKEIPKEWKIARMRYVCDISTGDKDTINKEEKGNYPFFVRSKNIERISTFTYDEEAILTPGDGDICKIWHYINGKFECHQRVYKLAKFHKVTGKFLYYFLIHNFEYEVFKLSAKSTVDSLRRPMFQNFPIAFGSIEEQTAIANYLDQKTTQIDDLIAKKERLIQLLEEERTAIINQAVTKGIVPTVPMKDSGIEWLGEIPEHWEVTKVKTVTKKIGSGVTPKGGAEIYELSGIPLLRSQNIYFDGFRLENVAYITSEIHDSMKNSQVQSGDVLLNITGGSIGRCYYVTDEFSEANVNQHVCIVRPNDRIITEFLYYVLSSTIGQQQIDLCQTGGNREALNFEQLKNFFMCLPEIDEQKSIVQQLNFKLNSINLAIEKFRKEIELIIEYKTALISEVVTGKVDVRQLVLN